MAARILGEPPDPSPPILCSTMGGPHRPPPRVSIHLTADEGRPRAASSDVTCATARLRRCHHPPHVPPPHRIMDVAGRRLNARRRHLRWPLTRRRGVLHSLDASLLPTPQPHHRHRRRKDRRCPPPHGCSSPRHVILILATSKDLRGAATIRASPLHIVVTSSTAVREAARRCCAASAVSSVQAVPPPAERRRSTCPRHAIPSLHPCSYLRLSLRPPIETSRNRHQYLPIFHGRSCQLPRSMCGLHALASPPHASVIASTPSHRLRLHAPAPSLAHVTSTDRRHARLPCARPCAATFRWPRLSPPLHTKPP